MSELISREPEADAAKAAEAAGIQIRRLVYSDLPAVIAIERRSFPAPWSLVMFVLELSKPSGICLAAAEGRKLVGYLICSRYDTVWHVMNVAIEPDLQCRGIGTKLLEHLLEQTERADRFTLEVRVSNQAA